MSEDVFMDEVTDDLSESESSSNIGDDRHAKDSHRSSNHGSITRSSPLRHSGSPEFEVPTANGEDAVPSTGRRGISPEL